MKMLPYPLKTESITETLNWNILVVGCGNSLLCEDMAKDHKGRIVGIDISKTVIKEMIEKHELKLKENPSMFGFYKKYL